MVNTAFAAFASPTDEVMAALAGQRALRHEPWGDMGDLLARVGPHAGEVEAQRAATSGPPAPLRPTDRSGPRAESSAHGGDRGAGGGHVAKFRRRRDQHGEAAARAWIGAGLGSAQVTRSGDRGTAESPGPYPLRGGFCPPGLVDAGYPTSTGPLKE
jgi:hypothetical protein